MGLRIYISAPQDTFSNFKILICFVCINTINKVNINGIDQTVQDAYDMLILAFVEVTIWPIGIFI